MDEKFVEQAEENVRRAVEAEISAIRNKPKLQPTVDCKDDWEYRTKRGRT